MATLSLAFHTGQLVQSRGIFDASCEHRTFHKFVQRSLGRHIAGDWGDCCPDDADLNDAALQDGGRIFSVYHIPAGLFALESKIWIITEYDRSYTTVLFPSEY